MKPVTAGPNVSGKFVGELETLVENIRTETADPGWALHIQSLQPPAYSLRVYSPDGHSEIYSVTITDSAAIELNRIFREESDLWQLRCRRKLELPN